MAAGKTAVGRLLAKRLAYRYYDSDEELEHATGVDIAWIFEQEGEQRFRERETAVIDQLTQHSRVVLSTGGGSILCEQNREYLQARGLVIYLSVSLSVQLERASRRPGTRPLLDCADPEARLRALNDSRGPIYTSLAEYTFDTDGKSPSDIVSEILAVL